MRQIPMQISSVIITLVLMFSLSAQPVQAQITWADCVQDTDVVTIQCIEVVFESIISLILAFVGLAAFIMIFVAGFNLLTAGGDPQKTETASRTLTLAVAGLAAALFVWYALQFLSDFTGVDQLLNFSVSIN